MADRAVDLRPFVQRCIACGTVFNALLGHSVASCAVVLRRNT